MHEPHSAISRDAGLEEVPQEIKLGLGISIFFEKYFRDAVRTSKGASVEHNSCA